MKRSLVALTAAIALFPGVSSALAGHVERSTPGPRCGDRFVDSDDCSFRYRGGQLYVNASVRGVGVPSGGAIVRLEARSRITGKRYVLLSCATPASGGCAAGGSYETLEHIRKGQKLFCIVDGHGRGEYECGTIKRGAH